MNRTRELEIALRIGVAVGRRGDSTGVGVVVAGHANFGVRVGEIHVVEEIDDLDAELEQRWSPTAGRA